MARRNLKKRKGITVCTFPASKPAARTIYVEGLLEKDFCYHLELDNAVVGYDCQPESITYLLNEKKHTYTPDFIATYEDSTQEYFEVKDKRFLDDDMKEKLSYIGQYTERNGIPLTVITDEKIRKNPFFSNLKRLYASRTSGSIQNDLLSKIQEQFENNNDFVTFRDLQNSLLLTPIQIHRLIYVGFLEVDINTSIFGPDCKVRLSDESI